MSPKLVRQNVFEKRHENITSSSTRKTPTAVLTALRLFSTLLCSGGEP